MEDRPRILFAILDWGLGHATRSIPLILEAQRQGAAPLIASAGFAGQYLRQELPRFPYISLPPYDIRYPYNSMMLNMGLQLPKLAYMAWKEQRQLQQIIRGYRIKAVVSDNRFGCWSGDVPSFFVTHQLQIRTPYHWSDRIANALNHSFISRYDCCWIPDLPGKDSLGGALSVPPSNIKHHYLGLLSRFSQIPVQNRECTDTLVLLSGPEPQRSLLERELLPQLRALPGQNVLVRGTNTDDEIPNSPNLRIHNYLGSEALAQIIADATLVVCRSGYSSLMDLSAFGKRALLIPTPGQTEQEYLGRRLAQSRRVALQQQGKVNLVKGIEAARQCSGLTDKMAEDSGKKIVSAVRHLIASVDGAGTPRSHS